MSNVTITAPDWGNAPSLPTRRNIIKGGAALAAIGGGVTFTAPYIGHARAQEKNVRFWTWLDPNDKNPRAQVQTKLVEAFTTSTGIKVAVEVVDWRTLQQQLIRAVAAGEGPDVTRIYSAGLPEQHAAKTLQPLDPMMAEVWSKEVRDDIGPPLPVFDGKTLAMYIENRIYLLTYRRDYLTEAGLDVPRTFEQVGAAAQKMASVRRSGLIWPASTRSTDTFSYASPMVWALGGEFVTPDKKAAFNGKGGVAFFTWLRDLVKERKAMPPAMISVDEEALQQAMNSGTCAMAFMGTNRVGATRSSLAANNPSVLQTVHAPSVDGKPPPVPVAGWCLGVTSNSKNPVGAFRLVDALTNTEAQVMNAKEAGEMPVRKSALNDPWFADPKAAEMRSWMEYVAAHGRDDMSQKLVKSREFNRLLNVATQQIVLEDRPVQAALDAAAEEWNRIAE